MRVSAKIILNLLTFLRFPLTIMFCYMINLDFSLISLVIIYFFIVSTDFIDGKIARKFNVSTKFGAMMDVLADMFFITASLFTLYKNSYIYPNLLFIVIFKFVEFIYTSHRYRKSILLFDKFGRKLAVFFYILPILSPLLKYHPIFDYKLNILLIEIIVFVLTIFSTYIRIRIIIKKTPR